MRKSALLGIICLLFAASASATEFSKETLSGKWMFTHMNMDNSGDRKVNLPMEFLANGVVINYDKMGNEKSRGSFKIQDNYIIYEDQNGIQKWHVKKFNKEVLHVEHLGVEMFFSRL